ncbi:glycosyltransferase family 4 protein, partial [Sphingomonas sp.]|uniref:glycosyltransferase n=1 Tax=Sphingomonas sp. TaxID=28214 RepID=UPI0025EED73D
QSRSLPVVAFNQGPIPEAMIDGTTGILVPDKDAGTLANALASLIDSPERRREMGEAGRQFVEEHFDITRQAAKLEELYDQVLAPQRPSGNRRHSGKNALPGGTQAACSD